MNTSETNCKSKSDKKNSPWNYPPSRPWIEFVLIIILTIVCVLSIASLMFSANEAKNARITAISRLEVIYNDLKKSENELMALKVSHIKDEFAFHGNLNRSMKSQTILLKLVAEKLDVPRAEIDAVLAKDPNY